MIFLTCVFFILQLLILLLLLIPLAFLTQISQAASSNTNIDLTTTYTPISKTSNKLSKVGNNGIAGNGGAGAGGSVVITRNAKTKLHKASQLSSPSQQQPVVPPTSPNIATTNALPAKSYITQPTTPQGKLLKRSGQAAELKLKKPIKEIRNHTHESERSSKLQEVVSVC